MDQNRGGARQNTTNSTKGKKTHLHHKRPIANQLFARRSSGGQEAETRFPRVLTVIRPRRNPVANNKIAHIPQPRFNGGGANEEMLTSTPKFRTMATHVSPHERGTNKPKHPRCKNKHNHWLIKGILIHGAILATQSVTPLLTRQYAKMCVLHTPNVAPSLPKTAPRCFERGQEIPR